MTEAYTTVHRDNLDAALANLRRFGGKIVRCSFLQEDSVALRVLLPDGVQLDQLFQEDNRRESRG